MNFTGASLWRNIRTSFFRPKCPTLQSWAFQSRAFSIRRLSTKAESEINPQELAKHKPKAATQLRRTAAASLPIRANPNPSRGEIRPVSVLTTAERYLFPQLRFRLPAAAIRLQSAWWIPRWAGLDGKEGEIFVFENGSLVCWGLEEADAHKFARDFISGSIAEVGHLEEVETEDVEFVTDPNEKTRIQGDLIILGSSPPPEEPSSLPSSIPEMVLPKDTLLARYAFSQGLARSSALSALESKLDSFIVSVSVLPVTLSKTGKVGLSRREVIMKLGELMMFRQGLNLNHENFLDTPDFYWAEPQLEAYFKSISDGLDIRARTQLLNNKITYASEVQSVLRELLTESSAHRMELIIILLISVEVVICLIRDGPDLWQMIVGTEDKESSATTTKRHH
ncbi:DUF155-domain-containing protein [Fomitiporia mediterranea MF3/22]|uniref:DUF155-domain-containing protein n=1 Tax=Fomitiporia mediterranea (strain MF3/22) TaxID=694068 RepID=UPI0004407AD3|nr:DUF155-domain-containing protein [Fomitiporia mediterranea MF3/22]EJD06693.1 DUF155-domain-containing protein [Fomitiporia mediterranea MF3/22]